MATSLVGRCGCCHQLLSAPKIGRISSLCKLDFRLWSKHGSKSLQQVQEEDIRADLEDRPKRRVQDFTGAELAELCDISRLPRKLKAKMSHRAELLPPVDKNAATIEKQRTLYAALGQKSGLPPGIMWPSKSQLKFAIEDEKTYFATLQEMIQVVKDEEELKKRQHKERQEEISRRMAEMPSLIAEFESKMKSRREADREATSKKREMLDEARDFFGYAIEENDDRIVKFLEQKEAAEKEKERAEKRAAKQAEAKRQLEELAKRATEEALKMAALDAEEKKKAEEETSVVDGSATPASDAREEETGQSGSR